MNRDDLLTTEEAAEYLGLTVGTLRNWRTPKLKHGPPHLKIGRYVRYQRGALMDWAQSQTGGEASP